MRYLFCLFVTVGSFVRVGYGQVGSAQVYNAVMADSIVREGKRLYASEVTSWKGTDLFLEKFKDQASIGGYFSYQDQDTLKCIFYSKGDGPSVIGRVLFRPGSGDVDLSRLSFTRTEDSLYRLRQGALKVMAGDTFYIRYQGTEFNLIPLLGGGRHSVYILTASSAGGQVFFGGDYLLEFDDRFQLISRRRLHHNLITVPIGGQVKQEAAIHSHNAETGDLITATDVCTLMLYEKEAGWKQHYVVSKNYVSIWDCGKNELTTLTMEAWNRINADQKNRH
jgi:hypothetical protein